MLQIGTVQTLSYRGCELNARSWSIKTCACKETKSKAKLLHFLFICFSVMNVGLLQIQWVKKIPLLTALDMTKFVQRQSAACFRMVHFQNGTQCQSETCFKMAHVSEWYTTQVTYIMFHLFQNASLEVWSTLILYMALHTHIVKRLSMDYKLVSDLKTTCMNWPCCFFIVIRVFLRWTDQFKLLKSTWDMF